MKLKATFLAAMLGGTAMSAVTAIPAQAQDAVSDPALEEIFVFARGRLESLQDIPISETVFTSGDIVDARIDTVDDFFALTPGVTFANAQDSGTNFITIRGVSQVRNGEPPVAVVIDDVLQVNGRSFDQPLFDLEAIEILRGPQGALYGRNATGGAIIIRTKAPTDELEGYGRFTNGSGDEFQVEGSVSGPIIEDKLLGRLSARYLNRDGVLQNTVLDEPVDYREDFAIRGHLKFLASERLTFDLRASAVISDGGSLNYTYQPLIVPDRTTGIPTGVDFSINDANLVEREFIANNLGVDSRDAYQVSLRINADLDFATLKSVTAYDNVEQQTGSDQFPYSADTTALGLLTAAIGFPLGDGIQSQFIEVEAFTQELRLVSPDDQRFRWMVGAYLLLTDRFINSSIYDDLGNGLPDFAQRTVSFDPAAPLTSFVADDNDNTAFALFFNLAYDVTEDLEIAFAGRYDRDEREQTVSDEQGLYTDGMLTGTIGAPGAVNEADFDLFQPKVTVRYQATETLNLFGSWGRGFRSGQFNQNGVGAQAANLTPPLIGISDLLPQEETSTFELGFKTSFLNDRITLNGSGYRTTVENAPYFVFVGALSAQILVPIDEIRIWGGEVELAANILEGLDFYASVGIADSSIQEYGLNPDFVGNRAPYVAKYTFNTGLQYRVPITDEFNGFGRIDYERRGPQFWDPDNSTERDALNLVNLRVGIEGGERWSFIGSIENLTDEEYNSELVLGGFAHAAQPRIWRLDLRVNF